MQYPNWFAPYAQRYFEKHLLPLAGRADLRFLQIGAFTGDASVWLLQNVLTGEGSTLTDVDTWEGSDEPEHEAFDWADVARVYDERASGFQGHHRLHSYQMTSEWFFKTDESSYDFIYIDGDHTTFGVLNDAVDAYRRLKVGGVLAFDDYLWQAHDGEPLAAPAPAINAISRLYRHRLVLLPDEVPPNEQAQRWFRKVAA